VTAHLSEVLAAHKTVASTANSEFDVAYHAAQRHQLDGPFHGSSRTYEPLAENGDPQPSQIKKVQTTANDLIGQATEALTRLFDLTATRDYANCQARADIVVGTETILREVPVTYLLWLEKRLVDIRTFVSKLPVLDPAEEWRFDPARDIWVTPPVENIRTSKKPRNHVRHPGSDKHAPQVDVYMEDIPEGTWTVVKQSGALSAERRRTLLRRIEALQVAVKTAREQANSMEVQQVWTGKAVFEYLFAA
jgi:hypothetical protein